MAKIEYVFIRQPKEDALKYAVDHKNSCVLSDDIGNFPIMYGASLGCAILQAPYWATANCHIIVFAVVVFSFDTMEEALDKLGNKELSYDNPIIVNNFSFFDKKSAIKWIRGAR